MSRVAQRDPEVADRVRRTGLFLAYVVLTLFLSSTALVLYRWWSR